MKGSRPFTETEVAAILRELKTQRDRALFQVGISAGFRISELLSLRVGDVWKQEQIVHELAVARANMKGKHEARRIPLQEEARKALLDWVTSLITKRFPVFCKQPEVLNWFLFKSREGENRPITRKSAWRTLTNAYRKCGLSGKLGTHAMRKSFAERVYENSGHDMLVTQEALGHKNLNSTACYVGADQKRVRSAILNRKGSP